MNSSRIRQTSVATVASVFVAALLAVPMTAMADQITYDIVDYPAAEIDINTSLQDKVSGTITASTTGPLGSYIAGSANPSTDPTTVELTYDITLHTSASPGTFSFTGSGTLNNYLGSGSLTFTSASILLDGYLLLSFSGPGFSEEMYWRSDLDSYMGSVVFNTGTALDFNQTPATTLDPSPWTIATAAAPEPATFTLLASALLGLVAVSWRRGVRRRQV
jgi:PEP-CTERM motif